MNILVQLYFILFTGGTVNARFFRHTNPIQQPSVMGLRHENIEKTFLKFGENKEKGVSDETEIIRKGSKDKEHIPRERPKESEKLSDPSNNEHYESKYEIIPGYIDLEILYKNYQNAIKVMLHEKGTEDPESTFTAYNLPLNGENKIIKHGNALSRLNHLLAISNYIHLSNEISSNKHGSNPLNGFKYITRTSCKTCNTAEALRFMKYFKGYLNKNIVRVKLNVELKFINDTDVLKDPNKRSVIEYYNNFLKLRDIKDADAFLKRKVNQDTLNFSLINNENLKSTKQNLFNSLKGKPVSIDGSRLNYSGFIHEINPHQKPTNRLRDRQNVTRAERVLYNSLTGNPVNTDYSHLNYFALVDKINSTGINNLSLIDNQNRQITKRVINNSLVGKSVNIKASPLNYSGFIDKILSYSNPMTLNLTDNQILNRIKRELNNTFTKNPIDDFHWNYSAFVNEMPIVKDQKLPFKKIINVYNLPKFQSSVTLKDKQEMVPNQYSYQHFSKDSSKVNSYAVNFLNPFIYHLMKNSASSVERSVKNIENSKKQNYFSFVNSSVDQNNFITRPNIITGYNFINLNSGNLTSIVPKLITYRNQKHVHSNEILNPPLTKVSMMPRYMNMPRQSVSNFNAFHTDSLNSGDSKMVNLNSYESDKRQNRLKNEDSSKVFYKFFLGQPVHAQIIHSKIYGEHKNFPKEVVVSKRYPKQNFEIQNIYKFT